jgi:hypothetical protein
MMVRYHSVYKADLLTKQSMLATMLTNAMSQCKTERCHALIIAGDFNVKVDGIENVTQQHGNLKAMVVVKTDTTYSSIDAFVTFSKSARFTNQRQKGLTKEKILLDHPANSMDIHCDTGITVCTLVQGKLL